MATPLLRELGVLVRPLAPRDAPAVAELREDRAVERWLPGAADATWPRSGANGGELDDELDDEVDGGAGPSRHDLAVEVDGALRAVVVLELDGEAGGWLSCAALPAARGAGTTAAAVRLVLTWAFAELGLQAVHWRTEVGNWPGRRLAWACGASVDGAVRCLLPARGDRRDAWVGTWRWDDALVPRERWLVPVELGGGGVSLGPHGPGDVARITEACASPSTQAWLPSLPSPYTVLDAATWVAGREEEQARGAGVYWAVRPQEGGPGAPLVAEVGLFGLSDGARSGEIGYWCHPDARGRGVTSAAVRLVAEHALRPVEEGGLGLDRVVVRVARGNLASRRVAVACGFRAVGVDRGAERLRDGTVQDFVRYDRLAPQSAPRAPAPDSAHEHPRPR